MMDKDSVPPERSKDRFIFMSMHNDIDWDEKAMKNIVNRIPHVLQHMPESFPRGHWSFLGPRSEEKGMQHSLTN